MQQSTIVEVQIHPSCHVVMNYGTVFVNIQQIARVFSPTADIVMYNRREVVIPAFADAMPTMPTVVLSNIQHLPHDRVRADFRVLFYRKELSAAPRMAGPCHPVWDHAYRHSMISTGNLTQSEWKLFRQIMCTHYADATLFLGELWKAVRPNCTGWDDLIDLAADVTSELVNMYNTTVPPGECLYRRRLMSFDRVTIGRACVACKEMKMGKQKRCPCRKGFYYCSKECQREHWNREHKHVCEFVHGSISP